MFDFAEEDGYYSYVVFRGEVEEEETICILPLRSHQKLEDFYYKPRVHILLTMLVPPIIPEYVLDFFFEHIGKDPNTYYKFITDEKELENFYDVISPGKLSMCE